MRWKRKNSFINPTGKKFDLMMNLIKDLDRANFNRLKDAMDLGYNAYQKVKNVKTADEKENEDIYSAEKILTKEGLK